MINNCLYCGNPIAKSPKVSFPQWAKRTYCTRTCSAAANAHTRKPSTRWDGTKREDAFWESLELVGECLEWAGALCGGGYAQTKYKGKLTSVHRLSYYLTVGEIPKDLVIDHLCRNRRCANPMHLEAVTPWENMYRGIGPAAINKRKTHCLRGHEFSLVNTHFNKSGGRECLTCRYMRDGQTLERVQEKHGIYN